MKNSVCTAGLSHSGVPMVLLMSSPSSSAKMTYSMPQSTNRPLPARNRASKASAKITGRPIRNGTTGRPSSAMPAAPTMKKPTAMIKNLGQISRAKTRFAVAAAWPRISVAERAGERAGAERGELAGFGLDRLAVGAGERVLQVVARAGDILLPLGIGVARSGRARRSSPASGRDLRIGGPAEARDDIAQVGDFPLEHDQRRGDDQEAEHDGDPVFCAPRARDQDRDSASRNGVSMPDCMARSKSRGRIQNIYSISRQDQPHKEQIISVAEVSRNSVSLTGTPENGPVRPRAAGSAGYRPARRNAAVATPASHFRRTIRVIDGATTPHCPHRHASIRPALATLASWPFCFRSSRTRPRSRKRRREAAHRMGGEEPFPAVPQREAISASRRRPARRRRARRPRPARRSTATAAAGRATSSSALRRPLRPADGNLRARRRAEDLSVARGPPRRRGARRGAADAVNCVWTFDDGDSEPQQVHRLLRRGGPAARRPRPPTTPLSTSCCRTAPAARDRRDPGARPADRRPRRFDRRRRRQSGPAGRLSDDGFCFRRFLGVKTSEYYRPGRAGYNGNRSCVIEDRTRMPTPGRDRARAGIGPVPPLALRLPDARRARRSRSRTRASPSPSFRWPARARPSQPASRLAAHAECPSPGTNTACFGISARRSPR